jgi:hypothetical protein
VIDFNSAPVDNGPAWCGSVTRDETVDNDTRRPQVFPISKNTVRIGFFGLSTSSTGPSTTTLFFLNGSNNE